MLEFLLQHLEIFLAAAIFLISIAVAKVVNIVIRKYITKWTSKTGSVLDDMMVKATARPVFMLVVMAGAYFSIKTLGQVLPYPELVNSGFTILFIICVAFLIARIINTFIGWYAAESAKSKKSDVNMQFVSLSKKIVYIGIFAIALVWMLNQLGIEITTLVATLGIGGLAVALALQPTLSNFFAGAYLMMDKPIRIGDYIELESGERGYIDEISWRSTRIKTIGNNYIILPNSKMSESKITNYFYPAKEMSVVIPCGVGYESDLEKVEKVTIEVADQVLRKTKGSVKGFKPFVRFNEFGDSNINFSVILRVNEFVNKYLITHEFIKALKKRYDKEKIEISWPVRKVHMNK